MALLEVNDIHTYYGNIHALKGISLHVEKGEIVSLIGGNGAGKTTTLRSISGLLQPRMGEIIFEGENLGDFRAHQLVSKGIAMVPEGRGVFARLSVKENLEMGAFHRWISGDAGASPGKTVRTAVIPSGSCGVHTYS